MWASHFVRNGNKLSISSWLAAEVQVSRNVGRPNPRLPNLVNISSESGWKNLVEPVIDQFEENKLWVTKLGSLVNPKLVMKLLVCVALSSMHRGCIESVAARTVV